MAALLWLVCVENVGQSSYAGRLGNTAVPCWQLAELADPDRAIEATHASRSAAQSSEHVLEHPARIKCWPYCIAHAQSLATAAPYSPLPTPHFWKQCRGGA
jgi:hypothetical protein